MPDATNLAPPLPFSVYRLKLRTVIENARADRDMLKSYRDRIAPLERRFNVEAKSLHGQLDDIVNALDALVTDAPDLS